MGAPSLGGTSLGAASSNGVRDALALLASMRATAEAHELFLATAQQSAALQTHALHVSHQLLTGQAFPEPARSTFTASAPDGAPSAVAPSSTTAPSSPIALAPSAPQPRSIPAPAPLASPAPRFDRAMCMEFAIGSIGTMLGARFAEVDSHPTRVRLPDEPLMLVDRILEVEGEPGSLTSGRVITEHDVQPGAWYLDGGRVPVCISVEAGQADLFLSAWLGIDLQTKGERVYRLLDAKVEFHRDLPQPGEVLHYDIRIDRFIKQGDTWLFFFRFDGTIDGQPFITMFDGCAGFFSAQQLDEGKGIVLTARAKPKPRPVTQPFTPLVARAQETMSEAQVDALRTGELRKAFGPGFPVETLAPSLRLPGGRMKLVDRILELDTGGGEAGLGLVVGEHDVTPDAWFLTCHFKDDPVMPGTLMYECCLHTLRVLLLRQGWVDDTDNAELHFAPIEGVASQLKCRGQVLPTTRRVQYRVEIEQLGYGPEPFVLATASMYADGKHIIQMEQMSVRVPGLRRERVEQLFSKAGPATLEPVRFTREQILEYCEGAPSKCFGPQYSVFDEQRRIARLPRPPYLFVDRVLRTEPRPFELAAGGWITCEYDVPPDAWYFAANRQPTMPFAVLLEAALQPCGFLAAYAGSALASDEDLKFRNLDGTATLHREVPRDIGTLTLRSRLTKISRAGGMILQAFDFEVLAKNEPVYTGTTGFGFFPKAALEQQVGIRGALPFTAPAGGKHFTLEMEPPLTPDEPGAFFSTGLHAPARAFSMIDRVERLTLDGGAKDLGFVSGSKRVDPSEWFFRAHFFQDPVMPGSLGLEALIQLLGAWARERFPALRDSHRFQSLAVGRTHTWQYRGQVVPTNSLVLVHANITSVVDGDEPLIVADGQLQVDGKLIYAMKDFPLRLVRGAR